MIEGVLASVLYLLLLLFTLALVVRIGVEMIRGYSPGFRPAGIVLIVCEAIYTVTDPPVKGLRAVIPPLRLGGVALDVSVLIIFFVVSIAMNLLVPFVI